MSKKRAFGVPTSNQALFSNRVLIVCTDWSLAKVLATTFETSGFDVRTALSAKEGSSIARKFHPALVVVDLDLLVADGFDFCWKLRNSSFTRHVRILMLSDGRGEESELMGLSHGADDYLLKPIQYEHLIYRVRVLLKQKTTHGHIQFPIRLDGLELDFDRRIATLDGIDLGFTRTEFTLVWTLAVDQGVVFNRSELVNQYRGDDADSGERTIDVHVRSIRRKLGKSSDLVETVRGVGYRFRDTAVSSMFEHKNEQDSLLNEELTDPFTPTVNSTARHLTAT
jgi:two-component system phosphate regulon response regulator PhoB